MDNLSEYIPLIIIIGSIVYSIIKGGVKKKLEETAKTTLPGKTSEETVWPENEIPPKAAVKKHVKKQKLPTPTLTVKGEQKKTIKTTSVVSNAETHLEEEPEYVKPFLDIEDSGEVKRAFIYAEILNRKNY